MRGQAIIECRCGATAGRLRGQATIECRCGATAGRLRGQATIEMLVMVGFAIVFIVPLAFLFLSASNNEIGKSSLVQAKATARSISDAAGEVYLQGAGARKEIVVNYPQGVTDVSVENRLVVLTLDTAGGTQDIVSATFANIDGDLSGKRGAGLQAIRLVNENGYVVKISYVQ